MAAGWSLQGKTVFVTGAARGIGAESARRLAERGANVALVGLEPEELERVAASCGPRAAWFEADVTSWDALEEAVAGTVERFGGIDIVIANAGIATAGSIRAADPQAFERTIDINLLGVWRTLRCCLPHVLERRGYVLVVASVAAIVHGPLMAAYSAAKAGAEALADSLRSEVAHHGVGVGVGYFSWIATDMVAGGDAHPVFGPVRSELRGPLGKTFPVSAVGDAVVRGVEKRQRWVTVPNWVRAAIVLRGLLGPLIELGARSRARELDELFARDVAERGEAASAPVGAGGQAVREADVNRS